MITEEEMMINLIEIFLDCNPEEFIEEYNRATCANVIFNDVDWKAERTNGEGIQYQIW